ncbi:hypothetical protein BHM03_00051351 [Ensete ventricosum]|nr:hypothetical protein BHM03_00051351 [Ensete ventricosum]
MGGWRLVRHYSDDVAHVRPTRLRRKLPKEWGGVTTLPDHGGDPAHTGDLIWVIRHPTLRATPTFGARRRAHVARSPLQSLPQSGDRGSSSTYPNRSDHASDYDRTLGPPSRAYRWGIPPTNQGGSREHSVPTRPGPTEQNPPEARFETHSIVPEKLTTPHLGEEHTLRELDTLSSDSTNSFRMQLRRVNKWLDEVQKEVTKSKEEAGENPKHKSSFAPEIQDKPVPTNFELPILESYDGSSDPTEHVVAFRAQMVLYDSFDALICWVFPTTLRGPARMLYIRLKPASIISFDQLVKELEQNFLGNARPKPTVASLLGIA